MFDVTCKFARTELGIDRKLTISGEIGRDVFLVITEGDECCSITVNGNDLILAIKHCMESEAE